MSYLMILEVSQKQAYIFSSNKLKDNIRHSENICRVTDPEYFEAVAASEGMAFSQKDNVVYSGGGHTVLEFQREEQAKSFAYVVSKTVKRDFPGLELFIKTEPYDEKEPPGENLKKLSEALEVKKSVRRASFGQGTFGVEKMDASSRKAKPLAKPEEGHGQNRREYVPDGYRTASRFEDLGNSKHTSSFIAVVHIDGNAMGKRVERLRQEHRNEAWEPYKAALKRFSDSIDRDFKNSYREMADRVAESLRKGAGEKLDLKENYFPVRQIILAGDDVCFVTEGRIGLEAARIFIEQLAQKRNQQDRAAYTACAGVAVVHQKYPFYKAYELAEMLCSNAKRTIAEYGAEGNACAIDWHIEFGELEDSIEALRRNYITSDNCHLELRPYILSAEPDLLEKEPVRRYENFKKFVSVIQQEKMSCARGKLKELREALREGETASEYYLKSSLLGILSVTGYEGVYKDVSMDRLFSGKGLDRKTFIKTGDNKKRSLFFDGIEIIDTFVALD
ncbi:MAG: hypothetical protein HFG74_09120 [Hungatella sp.]|nr:hypothetical protein [Hungatella sp.]